MSARPLKRARTSGVRVQRPIDKELKSVLQTSTTSMVQSTLKTTTFPGTVVGVRWSLTFLSAQAASDSICRWAIVLIPDGEAVNTIATSDGSDFYTPEQNVLAFGVIGIKDNDLGSGPTAANIEGTTKTMRKLRQGDILAFVTLASVANSFTTGGCIQFFVKT